MTIDYSKIKVGDAAAFEVAEINTANSTARLLGGGWIDLNAIVSHTPAPRPPLKVGDRVKCPFDTPGAREPFEIIWIEGDAAYFRPTKPGFSVTQAILSDVEQWERV